MWGRWFFGKKVRTADVKQVLFLTLILPLTMLSHFSHASTNPAPDSEETKRKIGQVEVYIREQTLKGMSILPQDAKTAFGWASGGWHSLITAQASDPTLNATTANTLTDQTNDDVPVSFLSNFHHKGFLPTHDAMRFGIGLGKNFFSDKLQFSAQPFYGQGWQSLQGYWGSELSLNVSKKNDDLPWGKVTIDYVGGNENMTDHGRGLDLHGDIDLTHHFQLTSGVKQNDVTGDTNYILLKWKIPLK